MSQVAQPAAANSNVPEHVTPELVQLFDFRTGLGDCPHQAASRLHDGPRIFYSPVSHQQRGGTQNGTWVLTKAEDIRYVLQHPELFSSAAPRAHAMGESWRLIPLEVDPPEHSSYRMLLNPLFSPNRLKPLDAKIRAWANELIDRFADKGECDFVADFAEWYPVGIFVDMLFLPRSHIPQLREWAVMMMHDGERRGEAMLNLKNFIVDVINERRVRPIEDDLVSYVVNGQINGRRLTDDEMLGICFLVLIAGLDTVVSASSFQFRYLAENPDQQAKLRADPSLIPDAAEELFRAFPVVTTSRLVTQDTEIAGVRIRKGETVTTSTLLSTRDPDEFPNPNEIDLTRSPNRHNTFSFGPHRCLGSHLARREIVIAIEEWTRRIPDFRVKPGAHIEVQGGGVVALESLPLVW